MTMDIVEAIRHRAQRQAGIRRRQQPGPVVAASWDDVDALLRACDELSDRLAEADRDMARMAERARTVWYDAGLRDGLVMAARMMAEKIERADEHGRVFYEEARAALEAEAQVNGPNQEDSSRAR